MKPRRSNRVRECGPARTNQPRFRGRGQAIDHGLGCERNRARIGTGTYLFVAFTVALPAHICCSTSSSSQAGRSHRKPDHKKSPADSGKKEVAPRSDTAALLDLCVRPGTCPDIADEHSADPDQVRAAITEEVRKCEGFACVALAVRAAQLECACAAEPKPGIAMAIAAFTDPAERARAAARERTQGFTKGILKTAQRRAATTASRLEYCQSTSPSPLRCLAPPGAGRPVYDVYVDYLEQDLHRFSATIESYFPSLYSVLRAEIESVSRRANTLVQTCRIADEDITAEQDPGALLEARGCAGMDMPVESVQILVGKLNSLREKAQRERRAREEEAKARELERANVIAADCSKKLAARQDERLQSPGCRSALVQATAQANYCAGIRYLRQADLQLRYMLRVDVESGTSDPTHRRELTQRRLFAEDQIAVARKALVATGRNPSAGDCNSESNQPGNDKVSRACGLARPAQAAPECTWLCRSYPSACVTPFPRPDLTARGYAELESEPPSTLVSSALATSQRLQSVKVVGRPDLPARKAGIARVRVGQEGYVKSVEVLQAESDAVGRYGQEDISRWRFQPALVGGVAIPFYFFVDIEPRRAGSVVSCRSKAWLEFETALQNFCSVAKYSNDGCFPGIGSCGKGSHEHQEILVPGDHDDFENEFDGPRGDGVASSSIVATFHWDNGWVVTGVRTNQVEFQGVE